MLCCHLDITPIKIFLSHSSKEKELAGEVKEELEDYGFEVFLAHSDILGGENWSSTLVREIKECDLFLVQLSKEFHRAEYTDQEVGIAYSLKKPIVPLSIDGTLPYGFMSKYQSLNAKDGIIPDLIFELAVTIYVRLRKTDIDIIESMIAAYADSGSYREANRRADMLFSNGEAFRKSHVNLIAEAFVENDQINNAASAKSVSLDLLRKRYSDLTPENREKLRKWIEPDS
jgi:hypothetical protein